MIWNGFDAKSDKVQIFLDTNDMDGLESVRILDQGDGISHSKITELFGAYSEMDAIAARSRISGLRVQQLREYFSSHYGTRSLEQHSPDWDAAHNALRDAMVCALIERGLSA